jgi:DNA-nicking Smr family endonuclease
VTGRQKKNPGLSKEDEQLWEMVKQRIKPLDRTHRMRTPSPLQASESVTRPRADVLQKAVSNKPVAAHPQAAVHVTRKSVVHPSPPAPAAIERRKVRRLAKGQRVIESVIDLHGMRQDEAHAALDRFLMRAYADGMKFVKVITGKGSRPPDDAPWDGVAVKERGVLRRMVPLWLAQQHLSRIVVGFSSAGRGHGGEGAYYIELRRSGKTAPR